MPNDADNNRRGNAAMNVTSSVIHYPSLHWYEDNLKIN